MLQRTPHNSASPVLTATVLVNGKWQALTNYRIDTPAVPIAKMSQVIASDTPYICVLKRTKFGQNPSAGPVLLGTHLQVKPLHHFSRLTNQTMQGHARVYTFWGFVDMAPHLWYQIPQNPHFVARVGILKPNLKVLHVNYP